MSQFFPIPRRRLFFSFGGHYLSTLIFSQLATQSITYTFFWKLVGQWFAIHEIDRKEVRISQKLTVVIRVKKGLITPKLFLGELNDVSICRLVNHMPRTAR